MFRHRDLIFKEGDRVSQLAKYTLLEQNNLLEKCTQICKDDRLLLRNLLKEQNEEIIFLLSKPKKITNMTILQSNLRKVLARCKPKKTETRQYITNLNSSSLNKSNNTTFERRRCSSFQFRTRNSSNMTNQILNCSSEPLNQLLNSSNRRMSGFSSTEYINKRQCQSTRLKPSCNLPKGANDENKFFLANRITDPFKQIKNQAHKSQAKQERNQNQSNQYNQNDYTENNTSNDANSLASLHGRNIVRMGSNLASLACIQDQQKDCINNYDRFDGYNRSKSESLLYAGKQKANSCMLNIPKNNDSDEYCTDVYVLAAHLRQQEKQTCQSYPQNEDKSQISKSPEFMQQNLQGQQQYHNKVEEQLSSDACEVFENSPHIQFENTTLNQDQTNSNYINQQQEQYDRENEAKKIETNDYEIDQSLDIQKRKRSSFETNPRENMDSQTYNILNRVDNSLKLFSEDLTKNKKILRVDEIISKFSHKLPLPPTYEEGQFIGPENAFEMTEHDHNYSNKSNSIMGSNTLIGDEEEKNKTIQQEIFKDDGRNDKSNEQTECWDRKETMEEFKHKLVGNCFDEQKNQFSNNHIQIENTSQQANNIIENMKSDKLSNLAHTDLFTPPDFLERMNERISIHRRASSNENLSYLSNLSKTRNSQMYEHPSALNSFINEHSPAINSSITPKSTTTYISATITTNPLIKIHTNEQKSTQINSNHNTSQQYSIHNDNNSMGNAITILENINNKKTLNDLESTNKCIPISLNSQGCIPISLNSHGCDPISKSSHGCDPISTSSHGYNLISTSSQGYNPISSSSHGNNPTSSSTHGNNPTSSSAHGNNPISTNSHGYNPISTSYHGYNPISTSSHGYNPISMSSHGYNHISSGFTQPPFDEKKSDYQTQEYNLKTQQLQNQQSKLLSVQPSNISSGLTSINNSHLFTNWKELLKPLDQPCSIIPSLEQNHPSQKILSSNISHCNDYLNSLPQINPLNNVFNIDQNNQFSESNSQSKISSQNNINPITCNFSQNSSIPNTSSLNKNQDNNFNSNMNTELQTHKNIPVGGEYNFQDVLVHHKYPNSNFTKENQQQNFLTVNKSASSIGSGNKDNYGLLNRFISKDLQINRYEQEKAQEYIHNFEKNGIYQNSSSTLNLAPVQSNVNSVQDKGISSEQNLKNNERSPLQNNTILEQIQNNQYWNDQTPNRTERTSHCNSTRREDHESIKPFYMDTNAKTDYEISDAIPFKFSYSHFPNSIQKQPTNMNIKGKSITNNCDDNTNDNFKQRDRGYESFVHDDCSNTHNRMKYSDVEGVNHFQESESGINPLEIQSNTKLYRGNSFFNKDTNTQMLQIEENSLGDTHKVFDFSNQDRSSCFNHSEQQHQQYINSHNQDYEENIQDTQDKFDDNYEENDEEEDNNEEIEFNYASDEESVECPLPRHVLSEEEKILCKDTLGLDRFTCEDISDYIFGDCDYHKISKPFFRLKFEQLLIKANKTPKNIPQNNDEYTVSGQQNSNYNQDYCENQDRKDEYYQLNLRDIDSLFSLLNIKQDGFLDVNELGFILQQICPPQNNENQLYLALQILADRLNLNRSYFILSDIISYFDSELEAQQQNLLNFSRIYIELSNYFKRKSIIFF